MAAEACLALNILHAAAAAFVGSAPGPVRSATACTSGGKPIGASAAAGKLPSAP